MTVNTPENIKPQQADQATPEEVDAWRRQQKQRLELLTALHVAAKGARFFPPQNESVVHRMQELLGLLKGFLESENHVALEVAHSFLMLNGERIKTDVAGLVPYNYVMETLQKLHCGSVIFDSMLTLDELRDFVYIFAKTEPTDGYKDPFGALRNELRKKGLKSVQLVRENTQSLTIRNEETRNASVDIYFRAIGAAKSVLQNAHSGKAVNFRKAKRAIQAMVDITVQDEFFLLAMTHIKNYDEYTYNHSANVAVLAITFGQHLGLSKKLLGALGMAAMFHDIGKTEIDREVLNKAGKLSRDEWDMLKSHPVLGVKNLLRSSEINEMLIRSMIVAFEHHKHVDLQGYPCTEHARDLNFLSRVVSICDVYDALTTPRIYRAKAYSAAEAFAIMLEEAGSAFDAALVNQFVLFLSLYPVGTLVRLNNGETGLVYQVRHEKDMLDRPFLKVVIDTSGNCIEPVKVDMAETEESGRTFKHEVVEVLAPGQCFKDLKEYLALL